LRIAVYIIGFIVLLIALALLLPRSDYPQEIPKNFRDSSQQIRCDLINKLTAEFYRNKQENWVFVKISRSGSEIYIYFKSGRSANEWVKTGAFGWVKGSLGDLLSTEEKIVLEYCYKKHRSAML